MTISERGFFTWKALTAYFLLSKNMPSKDLHSGSKDLHSGYLNTSDLFQIATCLSIYINSRITRLRLYEMGHIISKVNKAYVIISPGYRLIYLFCWLSIRNKTSKIVHDQRKAKNISSRTYVNLTYDNLFENQIMKHLGFLKRVKNNSRRVSKCLRSHNQR